MCIDTAETVRYEPKNSFSVMLWLFALPSVGVPSLSISITTTLVLLRFLRSPYVLGLSGGLLILMRGSARRRDQ